jgi:tetratricopeptide (TPR) repeat protein
MNLMSAKDQAYCLRLALRFEAMEAGAEVLAFRKEELIHLASYYREQGLYEQGIEVCDHAIQNHSYAVEFYLLKASILMDLSQEELSLICLEEAALFHPEHKEIPLLRAKALAALELYSEALELLQERRMQVESGIDLSMVYYYVAQVYRLSNQP